VAEKGLAEKVLLTAGVIGWPVSHSLSPKLHNHWLRKIGVNGCYHALGVEPQYLKQALSSLTTMGWRGCNLTIPHKETALALLDEVDDVARAIGAVNTVEVRGGLLLGTNTDAYGFIENIRPHLPATRNRAVVLGAGGASRAICYALAKEGFDEIVLTNRTAQRAEMLAAHFGKRFAATLWEKRSVALAGADLVVNTTSLGLKDNPPFEIDLSLLPATALVTDIVYTPLITPFLHMAQARGNAIVDGLGMLIHQAVPGFEAWFGMRPPVGDDLSELKALLLT